MKIAIIGGYGKMGMWLARHLQKEGRQVIIGGRDRDKLARAAEKLQVEAASATGAVEKAGAVIISVPIDSFANVVEDIAPFTHDGQLIFDVTSVKGMPVSAMHKFIKKGTVLGVHPMFGPGAEGLANQRFVLTPTNAEEEALAARVKNYLEARHARVETMSPQEHDDLISIVLGLSHFIALVSADTLLQTGRLEKAASISGTTFKLLLTLAESVLSEDPAFYASLQMNLPRAAEFEKLLANNAGTWVKLVKNKDSRRFAEKMAGLKEGFHNADPRFSNAYKEMYRLIGGY